jgi:hypothetical protein
MEKACGGLWLWPLIGSKSNQMGDLPGWFLIGQQGLGLEVRNCPDSCSPTRDPLELKPSMKITKHSSHIKQRVVSATDNIKLRDNTRKGLGTIVGKPQSRSKVVGELGLTVQSQGTNILFVS